MSVNFTWTDYSEQFDDENELKKIQFSQPIEGKIPNHILIKGDNYPVLKLLSGQGNSQTNLTNQINLIYIDPPYNTGNDFVYNDNFASGADKHSAWLSFMKRRLELAHELLRNDGCIFIAIDQSELYMLKLLCDQIFGEENFINDFMWLHGKGKKDNWSRTLQQHTLCYARNKKNLRPFTEMEYSDWAKTNADNDPRGNWFSGSISFTEERSNPKHHNFYSITSPSGKIWTRQWMVSREEMDELIKDNKIFWGQAPDFDKVPRKKIFNDTPTEVIPRNIIENVESTRSAQAHLDKLLEKKGAFDNPKPVDLISHLIEITQMPDDAVIMDFFAGSGTTFEAVCSLNSRDNGKRRCILVQKDENGIFELCKKRIEAVKGNSVVEFVETTISIT